MRYITEFELRNIYRNKKYQNYKIENNCRLTPGAKEFLNDFKIKIISDNEQDDELFPDSKRYSNNIIDFDNYKLIAVQLKIFAFKLKKYDFREAKYLYNVANNLYKNKKIILKEKKCVENLYDVYMNLELDNPLQDLFIEIDIFFSRLIDMRDNINKKDKFSSNLINKLITEISIYFINCVEGGNDN